jgi:hypothetical protein
VVELTESVVLFGQRRSGTTAAFEAFRSSPDLTCFYEPFHPKLVRSEAWSGPTEIERDEKHVYGEYRSIEAELTQHFAALGAPVFPVDQELDPASWTQRHAAYLRWLLDRGSPTLVQPVRVDHHLANVIAAWPTAHYVWILRDGAGVVSSQLMRHPQMFERTLSFGPSRSMVSRVARRLGRTSSMAEPIGHWSQGAAARWVLRTRPWARGFAESPAHVQMLALWYDHLDAVATASSLLPPERFTVLRYEDLCHDPDSVVGDICRRIGVRAPESSLRSLIERDPPPVYRHDDPRWIEAHEQIVDARRAAGLVAPIPPTRLEG